MTRTFQVPVQRPTASDVPPQDTVTPLANGGVEIKTARGADFPFHMAWTYPPSGLPSGAVLSRLEARVCGHASGDFYEVYGPYGTDPVEYEVTPPAADGCWHFVADGSETTDYDVTIYVYGDATMTIDTIELIVTTDR